VIASSLHFLHLFPEVEEINKRKSRRESRQQVNTRKREELLHKQVNQHLKR